MDRFNHGEKSVFADETNSAACLKYMQSHSSAVDFNLTSTIAYFLLNDESVETNFDVWLTYQAVDRLVFEMVVLRGKEHSSSVLSQHHSFASWMMILDKIREIAGNDCEFSQILDIMDIIAEALSCARIVQGDRDYAQDWLDCNEITREGMEAAQAISQYVVSKVESIDKAWTW